MYTYNISFRNHFDHLKGIFVFLVVFSLAPFYFVYRQGTEVLHFYVIWSTCAFLIFFIPQLILHLRFYRLDRRRRFYYTPDGQQLSLQLEGGRTFAFKFDEIERVERSKSFPFSERRAHWLPWDIYNYSVIRLKDGKQFVVTSLLVPNMDLPIEASKLKLRKRFYCYPFGAKEILDVQR